MHWCCLTQSHLHDCSFKPGEDVIRWRPTFTGRFDPEPQCPPVGGSAVVASHCPSPPGPQLNSYSRASEMLLLPPPLTFEQLPSSPFLLFPWLWSSSTQTVLGHPYTQPQMGIARSAAICPCSVVPVPDSFSVSPAPRCQPVHKEPCHGAICICQYVCHCSSPSG